MGCCCVHVLVEEKRHPTTDIPSASVIISASQGGLNSRCSGLFGGGLRCFCCSEARWLSKEEKKRGREETMLSCKGTFAADRLGSFTWDTAGWKRSDWRGVCWCARGQGETGKGWNTPPALPASIGLWCYRNYSAKNLLRIFYQRHVLGTIACGERCSMGREMQGAARCGICLCVLGFPNAGGSFLFFLTGCVLSYLI